MTVEPLISAENVGIEFPGGQRALDGVDLRVARGEFVSLVGPSGCGKSTLLRMIAGLMSPTKGTLTVAGRKPADRNPGGPRLAFVFQEPRLLPWRNVIDNIRLPLELAGVARDAQQTAAARSLKLIGLADADGGKFPSMLSGGMKMRVSLARALVTEPDILLLDEPFGALDDILRQQLNEELLRLWSAQRWTTLFVTHNVSEAVFLSQRVEILSKSPGRIVADIASPFDGRRVPSLRAEAEFARLVGEISERLRGAPA